MKNLFKICRKNIHLFENPSYRQLKNNKDKNLNLWNDLSIYEKASTLKIY